MWTYTKQDMENLIGRSIVLFDAKLRPRAAANIIHMDKIVLKARFMFDEVEFGKCNHFLVSHDKFKLKGYGLFLL